MIFVNIYPDVEYFEHNSRDLRLLSKITDETLQNHTDVKRPQLLQIEKGCR